MLDIEENLQKTVRQHIRSKHRSLEHKCNQCGKEYFEKNRLALHLKNKHLRMKYPCDWCTKQFHHGSLAKHKKSCQKVNKRDREKASTSSS